MNEYDRDNLNFLLTIDEATFKDWYDQMDADDHEYAQELLNKYAQELNERAVALRIEAELALNEDYALARAVIDSVK